MCRLIAPGGATRDAKEIAGTRPFQSLVLFQRKTVDCFFLKMLGADSYRSLSIGILYWVVVSNICLFSPRNLGKMNPFLTSIFVQRGVGSTTNSSSFCCAKLPRPAKNWVMLYYLLALDRLQPPAGFIETAMEREREREMYIYIFIYMLYTGPNVAN